MKIFIKKPVTITVKAGQEIDVLDSEVANLLRLGYAEKAEDPAPKKRKRSKKIEEKAE